MRLIGLLLSLLAFTTQAKTLSVTSPDGLLKVWISDHIQPHYWLEYDGQQLLQKSKLGLEFKQLGQYAQGFQITGEQRNSVNQSWQQPWGERATVADNHNALTLEFVNSKHPWQKFELNFKVFNDGIGFRYQIPQQANHTQLEIIDEKTSFVIDQSQHSQAWWIPSRAWNRYEFLYQTTPLHQVDRANTPFTFKHKSGIHLSIHEAALVDYASMSLDQTTPGNLKADLAPWSDGVLVKTKGAFNTPWRTIQVSPKATGLLNSDIILNLNEPNKLGDVSWVKPGKYIGIWWGMHLGIHTWGSGEKHGATTQRTKEYMDFAAEYGFDGVLVEGWNQGWDGSWFVNGDVFDFTRSYPDFDLPQVSQYAKQKGVKLIGHHETSGSVTNYKKQMDDAYKLYAKHGVSQIKSGYVANGKGIKRIDGKGLVRNEWHDGQFMVNEYLRSVTEAAKYKLSINTHEPVKDTGLRRTYPNWLSREGARGQEFNAWGSPPNPPEHTPMLAYTRMLSGPMDFTPGIFNLAYKGLDAQNRVQTTLMKQLALYVVLYSPIQMAADLPEHYLQRPDAFQFIQDVPTDWTQSIALQGEVGDFVVFARQDKHSEDWYLGAITDEHARQLEVKLGFLQPDQKYQAQIYRDGEKANWKTNPYDYVIETQTVTAKDKLTLKLATSGGTAIRFKAL